MNVLCLLQARMSSSRLPGKVMKPILGEPMILRQVERIRQARRVDGVTVATSTEASDDPLAALCAARGVDVHRGSLDVMLDRLYEAARRHAPRHVMRVTGDCPLIDAGVLDQLIDLHLASGADYTSNIHERSYPDGLDAEVFTFTAWTRAWREAVGEQRLHPTRFLWQTTPPARHRELKDTTDRSRLRWTVDYPEDFEFATRVFEALYPKNPKFSAADVHALLAARPEIAALNARHAS